MYYGYISYWLWEWLLSVDSFSGRLKFQKVASLLYVKDSVSQRLCCRGRAVSSCRASPAAYLSQYACLLACLLVTHVRLHCCPISLNCWNNFSVTMRFSLTTGKYCCSYLVVQILFSKYLAFLNLVMFCLSKYIWRQKKWPM